MPKKKPSRKSNNERVARKMVDREARRWGLRLTEEEASRMVHDVLAEFTKSRKAKPIYLPAKETTAREALCRRIAVGLQGKGVPVGEAVVEWGLQLLEEEADHE